MNNKGFTLVEVLIVVVLVSIISLLVIRSLGETLSLNKEESYKIMKKNIITASNDYINECISGTISCDFSFKTNNKFTAKVLKDKGYFKDLRSPIDNKNLENCLIIEASMDNGVIITDLLDNCY